MANRRLEEIKLLALCMASDNRDAFSRLVEIHQQGLRRFLLNLTNGNEALTDDLAQETFLKAWLAVRSFHGLFGIQDLALPHRHQRIFHLSPSGCPI